ncbi:hypothetical protein K440DRAFT_612233 [Wilcoxina mikolae CBS 423.85]|nr:hypothetical protein K440DRAFT_612233 [Wilcoxina mikolae CBS 423.85]
MAAPEIGDATRRDNNPSNKPVAAATMTWTTARCHRLIRPLTSKFVALKTLLILPSVTTTANLPKETKRDPDELPYNPSQAKTATRRPARRSASDREMFFNESRPGRADRVRRTYSANPTRSTTPQVLVPTIPNPSVYDLPFPAAAVDWDHPGIATASGPNQARTKTQISKELDPSHPQSLLQSLKSTVHPSVFHMYTGIYSALETVLIATTWTSSPCEPAPLKILAARRIAQCILATEDEIKSDDVWYDTANEVGVGGEYLREIVRWHAIEIIRDAICSNIMPSQQKNGVGLPSALVGLCKHLGADAEAESLLKTMIELYPLSESTSNPSLVALMNSWRTSKAGMFRILADTLVVEGSPIPLGNPTVNKVLKSAMDNIEKCDAASKLVVKALETGFGIWGNGYIAAASKERKERARRKGNRRPGKIDDVPKFRSGKSIPIRVVERAEEMALLLTEKLVVAAQIPRNAQAIEIIKHLTHGFLVQDEAMRAVTEDEWTEWYPIAGKVTILLQRLGHDSEDDIAIVKELVRCLDDVRETIGKDGLKSLGEFVASCYESLYTTTGKSITGEDEMKALVNRLVSYASNGCFPPHAGSVVTSAPAKTPETPLKPSFKVVTFTPGKKPIDPQLEKERYYITQLALNVAIGFSTLKCTKHNDKWNRWVGTIEHQIIGMKIRTPVKTVAVCEGSSKESGDGTNERKGWRWEEGLDEWIAVGGTPGGALREKIRVPRLKKVEILMNVDRKRTWRKDYQTFSDRLNSESTIDEDAGYCSYGSERATSPAEDNEEDNVHKSSRIDSPPSPISQNTNSDSEDPDTSFSRLFDNEPESSASEVDDNDDNDGEYYVPTPARPPASVRRSPRKTERIKRSLQAFSVVLPMSSPMFSKQRRSDMNRFTLTELTGSSSPSPSPPLVSEEEEDDEYQVIPEPSGLRHPRNWGYVEIECDPSPSLSAINDEKSKVLPSFSRNSKRRKDREDSLYEEEEELSEDELSVVNSSYSVSRRTSPERRTSTRSTRRKSLLCVMGNKRKAEGQPAKRASKRKAVAVRYGELSEDELAL